MVNANTYGKISSNISYEQTETTNRHRRISRQSHMFGDAFLAVGIANSLALTDTYEYRGLCPTPDGGKQILDKWDFGYANVRAMSLTS